MVLNRKKKDMEDGDMYMEERHHEILKCLSEKGRISNADIQERFGISYDSAKRDLRILEEKG